MGIWHRFGSYCVSNGSMMQVTTYLACNRGLNTAGHKMVNLGGAQVTVTFTVTVHKGNPNSPSGAPCRASSLHKTSLPRQIIRLPLVNYCIQTSHFENRPWKWGRRGREEALLLLPIDSKSQFVAPCVCVCVSPRATLLHGHVAVIGCPLESCGHSSTMYCECPPAMCAHYHPSRWVFANKAPTHREYRE